MISTTYAILAFCFMYVKFVHSSDTDFTKETETTECRPGYTGENCGIPCRHPSYGPACQERCHCTEIKCDHVTGCKVCPIGYTGDRCELPCRFPTYGDLCQMECSCAEEFCNFTYGCSPGSTNGKLFTFVI
ncbi:protein draper-like [Ostrea edulis]|uniref:protein draper-like n=1 Tax=Ostrea edulis TaxID=37623 RepID=UPI0024AFCD13|nr:protein draper-like [Ostrea edulis]